MNPPNPVLSWFAVGFGLFIAWHIGAAVRTGSLTVRGRFGGGYTLNRKTESGTFWIHAIYGALACLFAIYVGLKGIMGPSFPFPGQHPMARYIFPGILGFLPVSLIVAYLRQGYVPSSRSSITRRDRPLNFYITLVVFAGLAGICFFLAVHEARHPDGF